jgi:hypothetical protein
MRSLVQTLKDSEVVLTLLKGHNKSENFSSVG